MKERLGSVWPVLWKAIHVKSTTDVSAVPKDHFQENNITERERNTTSWGSCSGSLLSNEEAVSDINMDTQSVGEEQLDTDSLEVHMCMAVSSQVEDYSTEGSPKPLEDQTRGLEGNIIHAKEKNNLDVATIALPPSHCHHRIATIALPPSHCHHRIATIALPPSHCHHRIATIALPPSHCHHRIATIALPPSHCHHRIATIALPPSHCHHRIATIALPPSHCHHRIATIALPPSHCHHRIATIALPPSHCHHRIATIALPPSHCHLRIAIAFRIATFALPPSHWFRV